MYNNDLIYNIAVSIRTRVCKPNLQSQVNVLCTASPLVRCGLCSFKALGPWCLAVSRCRSLNWLESERRSDQTRCWCNGSAWSSSNRTVFNAVTWKEFLGDTEWIKTDHHANLGCVLADWSRPVPGIVKVRGPQTHAGTEMVFIRCLRSVFFTVRKARKNAACVQCVFVGHR